MQQVSDPDTSVPVDVPAAGPSAGKQIVAQQAAIAQIGQSALTHDSLDELFAEASALVSRVLGTELVSVLELSPDRQSLKVVAGVGWRPGVVGELIVGAARDSQAGYTLETGGPVIVADLAAERRFAVSPVLTEHGAISGMGVRIGGPDRPYGVLSVFTARRGRFSRDDTNFLQAVANVLGAAVVRFRAEADMRASRDQLAAIVSTIDEGITVSTRTGLLFANDAAAALTGFASADELVNAPLADVLDRYELFDEYERPMPVVQLPGRRAMAGEERPEAIVGFRIRATREMRWSLVRGTAVRGPDGAVTHVINTFRDVTPERWGRDARAFMADAVAVLSSTLDTGEAAVSLAKLAVPKLADYCVVHMLDREGSLASVALAHADPERRELALRAQAVRPLSVDAPTGPARVVREGVSEIVQILPEMIEALDHPPEELDLLRRLEMHAYICVPLMGREAPIGTLTLVTAESRRPLGERELALAEELGARAGVALENAQLYQTANERRTQLDAVLGALAEGVLVFDGEGQLQLGNSAAEAIFGGRLPADIAELRARAGLALVDDDASAGTDDGAVELQPDGGNRWVEMRRYRARGAESSEAAESRTSGHSEAAQGHAAPTVVVLRDVTEARAARAARDAFLGVLSHELRTPITMIYGGSELLERGLDDARRDEVISDIRVEAERLARLVEDLLVMTRIERGTVEIGEEPILIQRLLPSVVQAFTSQWPGVKVALDMGARLSAVRGDPTYVEQVVRNLLTNAVRYGDAGTKGVEIEAEEGSGEVIVRVLDRGAGFGDIEPDRLFELFYRSDAARAVPGGAGIGLFVCRHLVEAMGGRIWARPREDGGSEFGFLLQVLETDLAG